jgi:hypothetical protein
MKCGGVFISVNLYLGAKNRHDLLNPCCVAMEENIDCWVIQFIFVIESLRGPYSPDESFL